MKRIISLLVTALAGPLFALPTAKELSTRELVGQTIMPRVVIGKHKAFKKAVQKGEVTGFFIKTYAGLITHPKITVKKQAAFTQKQRKLLLKTISDLQNWAQQNPRQIPLLLAIDYEGGTVTSPIYLGLPQMPSNMLLAATGEEQLVAELYAAQAAQLRDVGANVSLGPDTDVNSNPQNPIIQTRSFGDNPHAVGRLAAIAAQALEENGVAAVNKHFPGHGDTATDSHYMQPVTNLSAEELEQIHVAAFVPSAKISSGIMTSHIIYPAWDATNSAIFSPVIIQGILRDKLGFTGLVFTDGLDMRGVGEKTVQDIVLDGYSAGNDILLLTGATADIKNSVRYPRLAADYVEADLSSSYPLLSRARLEESVQKVLRLKTRLAEPQLTDAPDLAEVSRRVARAGVTLVRDTVHALPLRPDVQQVCTVFFAEDIFSTQLASFNFVLEQQGKTVHTVHAPLTPEAKTREQALQCVQQAEAVVVGTSYKNKLDVEQYALVTELRQEAALSKKPFVQISLLNPYELQHYTAVPTVLAVYGPMRETMEVSAEIVLGQASARGTLPVTIP